MSVHGPELPQHVQGLVWQRHQPVFVDFGVANMHPHPVRVDIADGELDAFTQAQPHAVAGEKEDLVTQNAGCGKQLSHLFDRQDIRYSGGLGRFDQWEIFP